MKIVVLHGDDTDKSYKRFSTILKGVKKKGWNVEEISVKDDIKNKLVNTSLFDSNVLYTIKNAEKIDKGSLNWLNENHSKFDAQLLLYSQKKIPATVKKSLPKSAKIENFERPVLLWKFLDSIFPGNSKQSLAIYTKISETEATELVVSLLGGLFRDMYVVHSGGKLPYPDWRAKKISSQARKFTKSELKSIIAELAEIDYKSKTSDVDANLLIEMLLIKNLG